MEKQVVLLDTKKEYIQHLLDIFTIPIAKRIYKIFNDNNMNIKKFQEELVLIKIWNNNRVIDEYNEIIKKTKCNYFEKLLKKIILLDIKIKIEFDVNLEGIHIIKPCDFIHKCLINSAVYCWKNVYLFSSKNLKPSEKQYHLNLIEKNIRKIIKNTIRNIVPYEYILDLYEEQQKNKKLKKIVVDDESEAEDDEEESEAEDDDEDDDDESDAEDDDDDDESEAEDDDESEAEEVKEEVKEEIKEEVKEEIKEEVKEEIKEEVKEEDKNTTNYNLYEDLKKTKREDDLESLLEDDNDFIDTSIFKKKEKKKKETSYKSETDEESETEEENDLEEDEIKRINITNINKKNRH